MTGPLLAVERLSVRFGGLSALDAVDLEASAGEITAIIGPNGAGKSTLFNCITGFCRPSSGSITIAVGDRRLALQQMPGHRIASRAGIARTFQQRRVFGGMTVLENLLVAQHRALSRAALWSVGALVGLGPLAEAERAAIELARHWLDRFGLTDTADRPAASLPPAAQRRLEIARALCTRPRLLCLDEPAAGLDPRDTAGLGDLLLGLRAELGLAILLIEHDMGLVMGIADRVVVLDYGRKIAEGPPDRVRPDPDVIRAYLGEPEP